jgi:uncharacterized membrane-anchored protein YitT (DUF2179 family)
LNGAIIAKLFPSKKIVKCEVSSTKIKTINSLVFKSPRHVAYPIKKTNNKKSTTKFICSYLEFTYFLKEIKEVDEKALIVSSFVHDIDGPIDLYKDNFKN